MPDPYLLTPQSIAAFGIVAGVSGTRFKVREQGLAATLADGPELHVWRTRERSESTRPPLQVGPCGQDCLWNRSKPRLVSATPRTYCSPMIAVENMLQVIVVDPEIMSGMPVFAGTRVPVQTLFNYLESGDDLAEFLEDFPSVSQPQVLRVLELSRDSLLSQALQLCA